MDKPIKPPLSSLDTSIEHQQAEPLMYPLKTGLNSDLFAGHYMTFYVNLNENSSYDKNSPEQKTYYMGYSRGFNTGRPDGYGIGMPTAAANSEGWFGFPDFYKRTSTSITLYIPSDSISFLSRPNWEDVSLTELGGSILKFVQNSQEMVSGSSPGTLKAVAAGQNATLGTIAALSGMGGKEGKKDVMDNVMKRGMKFLGVDKALLTTLKKIDKTDFLARSFGFAVNPQILVLYKDIGMRQFTFSFIFTPHNPSEAKNVRNIIKMFRFHAHPEVTGSTGRFHIAPSTFDIEFSYRGNPNTNIPKISTCAITGISVDYSPYGWSTYTDGMPVQTHLTMHFKEMEVMTQTKINKGF